MPRVKFHVRPEYRPDSMNRGGLLPMVCTIYALASDSSVPKNVKSRLCFVGILASLVVRFCFRNGLRRGYLELDHFPFPPFWGLQRY